MNFGNCVQRDQKPSHHSGTTEERNANHKTSVHAIWLHRAGITLFHQLLVGHHPSLVYDVTFD